MKVDIKGIDKGELLAALYNNSMPMGKGIFQASRGPEVMTTEIGQEIISKTLSKEFGHDTALLFDRLDGRLYFDYLFGRPLKVDLTGDEVEAWGYDRDNGGDGTLKKIVDNIRWNNLPK